MASSKVTDFKSFQNTYLLVKRPRQLHHTTAAVHSGVIWEFISDLEQIAATAACSRERVYIGTHFDVLTEFRFFEVPAARRRIIRVEFDWEKKSFLNVVGL